jgi:2-hydroxychromene-2-carboxylate isomerase
MKAKRPPRFYFSFRSPFAWIAVRLAHERLTAEEIAGIDFIPYWEPEQRTLDAVRAAGAEFLYAQMSREKHLYILQDIRRLCRSLGYQHFWPIDENPHWELPNRAYIAARQAGKGPEFMAATYRSRWEKGENIHTVNVVRQLAAEVDLAPEWMMTEIEMPATRDQAVHALVSAYKDGVFGVPFFVNGFEKFWGVDRFEAFIASLRHQSYSFFQGGSRG